MLNVISWGSKFIKRNPNRTKNHSDLRSRMFTKGRSDTLNYTEPKWTVYTVILQIANTILNQCISHCFYKIGHITKAILGVNLKVIGHV